MEKTLRIVLIKLGKIIIKIIFLILIILLAVWFFDTCTRTPKSLVMRTFNISLKDFDYKVETFEDQWHLNGDGHVKIVFHFNELTQKNIDYFKSLGLMEYPISESEFKRVPSIYRYDNGFYIYEWFSGGGFKIFAVDTDMKRATFYYCVW